MNSNNYLITTLELQEFIHVYSMFSFHDGRKEAGICINKYNLTTAQIEYYFIPQINMQAYKTAFERYEKETCSRLSTLLKPEDLMCVRTVSLSDYKIIIQLLQEKNQLLNSHK